MTRSYLGGEAYAAGDYLVRHPRETAQVYEARKKRAYYLNFVAAIVDHYASEVFRLDPAREIAGPHGASSAFAENATGDGTPLSSFVRDATISALLASRAYVGADLDPGGTQTPYVYSIHPSNLLDYAADRTGAMLWALVAEQVVLDSDPFEDRRQEERYRLWTPEAWMLFDRTGALLEEGENAAGRVPIVVLDASDVRLPIYDIAQNNRGLYNLCSLLDEQLYGQTFAQLYVPSGDGLEGENDSAESVAMQVGVSRVLLLPSGVSMAPGFAAPPDGPTRTLREERQDRIAAMYSMAGLERRDPDAQKAQSGVAKSYDFRETNARLAAMAQMAEDAEVAIFDLLADYGVAGPANVTYHKDFDVRAFVEQLASYLQLVEAPLPVEVKKRAAMDLSLRVVEEGAEEEKRAVREAVEAMSEADFPKARVVPATGSGDQPVSAPPGGGE